MGTCRRTAPIARIRAASSSRMAASLTPAAATEKINPKTRRRNSRRSTLTMRKLLLLSLLPLSAFAQPNGWNDPFPPHKIMDNVYYVGTKELATFLIVTPQGNILMNSNYEASVPVIRASVEKLGFKMSDVKILIAGHAHPDHVE